ncbi:AbrB/MazE/SpoVT family DNA-binding domain-containing protein [uncultured Desulfosarcina sp.]|uniref:AbrB/MazE/SpoVT family DNA-binding domain-containing protein n=1 Tax=uncultured Desulfosarcina sp. TaxID=218289 RepID=UPI0029C6A795|nr:AbrB/MazE/SpoVT family DNA-binding domain-containing protein [uncultured Desulfosarcina sp.]
MAKKDSSFFTSPVNRTHRTKVTSKGQITVPKPIREHLNLAQGDRIEFLIGINGEVTIMPATADVRKLKGMVKNSGKPVAMEDMNRAIEDEAGRIR